MNDFIVTINDIKKEISLTDNSSLIVNGEKLHYEISLLNGDTYTFRIENKVYVISAKKLNGEKYTISIDGNQFETIVRTALQEKASQLIEKTAAAHHKLNVKAPMPGMILKIKKNKGEQISQGDSIMILEAMKMENDLRAPASGTIVDIQVREGIAVEKGAVLFSIE